MYDNRIIAAKYYTLSNAIIVTVDLQGYSLIYGVRTKSNKVVDLQFGKKYYVKNSLLNPCPSNTKSMVPGKKKFDQGGRSFTAFYCTQV